jgi:hypothetical protein
MLEEAFIVVFRPDFHRAIAYQFFFWRYPELDLELNYLWLLVDVLFF